MTLKLTNQNSESESIKVTKQTNEKNISSIRGVKNSQEELYTITIMPRKVESIRLSNSSEQDI